MELPDGVRGTRDVGGAGRGRLTERRRLPRRGAWPTICGLFLAVTALRWHLDTSGEAVALLYVVPIALSALWRGRRGGATAAAVGAGLFVVLAALHGRGDLDATGWAAPLVAMALIGGLVGEMTERVATVRRLAAHQSEEALGLQQLCERQEAALAATDSVVQRLAAARWMLEAGRTEQAVDVLTDAVADGITQLHPRGGRSLPARPARLRVTGE